MNKEPENVEEVLAELDELAATHEEVCVGDVLDDFGGRSFGASVIIPPLIEFTPVGGIPGVPTFLALIVAIVAVQMVMGRDHIWMPEFIRCRAVKSRKLHKAVRKLHSFAEWLDNQSHGRMEVLTTGVWTKVAGVVIILLCLAVLPLEFLPFASSLPMLAIAIMGLALLMRDGALMLAALMFAALAFGIGGFLYAGPGGEGTGAGWL
ncbi:MAG: exopolysaccharide biosynthesis protein [Qipengyuania sp.]